MKKFGEHLTNLPDGLNSDELRKARRVRQVRDIWASLVEQPILDHTNAVYIFTKDGKREMHVYVDESIYAAELNNRRELLKMLCRERHGEELDSFNIHISRGARKQEHPFAQPAPQLDSAPPVPLDTEELVRLEEACENIPESVLKQKFKKAMQADLEWKKGQKR